MNLTGRQKTPKLFQKWLYLPIDNRWYVRFFKVVRALKTDCMIQFPCAESFTNEFNFTKKYNLTFSYKLKECAFMRFFALMHHLITFTYTDVHKGKHNLSVLPPCHEGIF